MAVNVNIPITEKSSFFYYAGWSRDIKFQLTERNAWGIVKGTKVRPEVKPKKIFINSRF